MLVIGPWNQYYKNQTLFSHPEKIVSCSKHNEIFPYFYRTGAKQVARGNAVLADPDNPYSPGELIVNFDSQPSFSKFYSYFLKIKEKDSKLGNSVFQQGPDQQITM